MLALDTSILIRYLANDDPQQSSRAKTLVDTTHVFVSTTVLLETEWVLRSSYRLPRLQCAASLRSFAGLPHVRLADPSVIATALDLMDAGMDFADAVHLQAARECDALISFDRDLAKVAARLGTLPVRAP